MNEAQTLLEIENFMLKATKRKEDIAGMILKLSLMSLNAKPQPYTIQDMNTVL